MNKTVIFRLLQDWQEAGKGSLFPFQRYSLTLLQALTPDTMIHLELAGRMQQSTAIAIRDLYDAEIPHSSVTLQRTNREFEGDFTIVVFPLVRFSKKSPAETAEDLGKYLTGKHPEIVSYNIVKGFLNLSLSGRFWLDFVLEGKIKPDFGCLKQGTGAPVVIEYSSPNTNKPLHLGHIRNNLIGFSLARILEANGKQVWKVNLVNDRGIHVCKSMLAWQKWGCGETPAASVMKGDHLVGKYYVLFESQYRKEIQQLVSEGVEEEVAVKTAPIIQEAQEMLRKWETRDPEVLALWNRMNGWVYEGFDRTYEALGITFDRVDYESGTYLLGKALVDEGLAKGIFEKHPDGSVWVDLTDAGMDQKLLLRGDGTSVYITQDLGTAQARYDEFRPGKLIYVVGNEQNYHFDVLINILKKLGRDWAGNLLHLSYGMVELPEGKMKSREGKVVDADDLIDEMVETARKTAEELGKIEGFAADELAELYRMIGLGALKYFILKVDPKKNMLFNPAESIDFNGNTGPFIQYTHARIRSVLRKAAGANVPAAVPGMPYNLNPKERNLARLLYEFPATVELAGETLNPAVIANYTFELVKEYNQFYQEYSILKAESADAVTFRLALSGFIGNVIRTGMHLLGIEVPEKM